MLNKSMKTYQTPKLIAVGTVTSTTRMMLAGPYADAMLGLMMMQ